MNNRPCVYHLWLVVLARAVREGWKVGLEFVGDSTLVELLGVGTWDSLGQLAEVETFGIPAAADTYDSDIVCFAVAAHGIVDVVQQVL